MDYCLVCLLVCTFTERNKTVFTFYVPCWVTEAGSNSKWVSYKFLTHEVNQPHSTSLHSEKFEGWHPRLHHQFIWPNAKYVSFLLLSYGAEYGQERCWAELYDVTVKVSFGIWKQNVIILSIRHFWEILSLLTNGQHVLWFRSDLWPLTIKSVHPSGQMDIFSLQSLLYGGIVIKHFIHCTINYKLICQFFNK